jgi:hypothetical protein
MIRPLTVAAFLIACGSGLYLYQSKHEVQLLDRTIEKTVHDTGALREQSRLLSAEWTMLNDPERLRQFSDTYLNLRSINPAQFTSLGDLDGKLPGPRDEVAAPSTDEEPIAVYSAPQPVPEPAPVVVNEEVLPVPPIPFVRPPQSVATVARPPETKVAVARPANVDAPARPVAVTEPRPSDQRSSDPRRAAETHSELRASAAPPPRPIILASPKPRTVNPPSDAQPVSAPFQPATSPTAAPAPFTGSLLGMARGTMPPSPRPTPVNATYNAN